MIDLEMLEKTIVLMKKYGLQRLENNDLRLEMQWGQISIAEPVDPQMPPQEPIQFMQKAKQLQEIALKSSDEDILMNPYHGLDDLELLDHSHNKEKGK